jgi:hypothetical protein
MQSNWLALGDEDNLTHAKDAMSFRAMGRTSRHMVFCSMR